MTRDELINRIGNKLSAASEKTLKWLYLELFDEEIFKQGDIYYTEKVFPAAACVALVSGKLLCEISTVHELADYVMGHPIWSHELSFYGDEIKRELIRQHPILKRYEKISVDRNNAREVLREIESEIGTIFRIRKGEKVRDKGPDETFVELLQLPQPTTESNVFVIEIINGVPCRLIRQNSLEEARILCADLARENGISEEVIRLEVMRDFDIGVMSDNESYSVWVLQEEGN